MTCINSELTWYIILSNWLVNVVAYWLNHPGLERRSQVQIPIKEIEPFKAADDVSFIYFYFYFYFFQERKGRMTCYMLKLRLRLWIQISVKAIKSFQAINSMSFMRFFSRTKKTNNMSYVICKNKKHEVLESV